MSYDIAWNKQAFEFNSGEIILFLKVGANNLRKYNGELYKDWHLYAICKSKADALVDLEALAIHIGNGDLQIRAHSSKTYDGYFDKELDGFNWLKKTVTNPIKIDMNLSDVNLNNIAEVNKAINQAFDGASSRLLEKGYKSELSAEEEGMRRLSSVKSFQDLELSRIAFFEKCKGLSGIQIASNKELCQELVKVQESPRRAIWMLDRLSASAATLAIPNENLQVFLESDDSFCEFIKSYSTHYILTVFPQIEEIIKTPEFKERALRIVDLIIKDEPYGATRKQIDKNLDVFDNFNFTAAKSKIVAAEVEKKAKSKEVFLEHWNKLSDYAWYKSTNNLLPERTKEMMEALGSGTFSIDDAKARMEDDFRTVARRHHKQANKNKPAVLNLAKLLYFNFHEHISDETKQLFEEYFRFEKPALDVSNKNDEVFGETLGGLFAAPEMKGDAPNGTNIKV